MAFAGGFYIGEHIPTSGATFQKMAASLVSIWPNIIVVTGSNTVRSKKFGPVQKTISLKTLALEITPHLKNLGRSRKRGPGCQSDPVWKSEPPQEITAWFKKTERGLKILPGPKNVARPANPARSGNVSRFEESQPGSRNSNGDLKSGPVREMWPGPESLASLFKLLKLQCLYPSRSFIFMQSTCVLASRSAFFKRSGDNIDFAHPSLGQKVWLFDLFFTWNKKKFWIARCHGAQLANSLPFFHHSLENIGT